MSDHANPPPETLKGIVGRLLVPVRELLGEPLPRGVGIFHTTGSMCVFLAVHQIITGILMAFYYTPSPEVAWESIRYVDEKVAFGRVVHGLHHWGSSAFVVLVFIHMIRVFVYAAYKGRRRWTWSVGVALFFVVLGFGFTGYLLPWDMKAYFGTKVGANILGYAPLVGPGLKTLILGGPEISELTMPRFYALHVLVLPALLLGLMGLHLFLIRLHGITPPWTRDDEPVDYPWRFFPDQAVRDSAMVLGLFLLLLLLAAGAGANLGEKADPTTMAFAPHPEWYFLGLQQLLRYFQGRWQLLGTFVIPSTAALLLVLLPFLDRNPERRLARRPVALTLGAVAVLAVVGLTIQGYLFLRVERRELARLTQPPAEPETETATPAPQPAAEASDREFSARDLAFGERIYGLLRCAECHAGEGVGRGLNIPPSLDFSGDRFRPDWLMGYLQDIPERRYEAKNRRPVLRMPDYRLNPRELRGLTAYLTSLTQPDLFELTDADFGEPSDAAIELGRRLYAEERCGTCHVLAGAGEPDAPDLDGVGRRLRARFIYQIIRTPQRLIPGTTMEDSLLDADEVRALTQFLMSQP